MAALRKPSHAVASAGGKRWNSTSLPAPIQSSVSRAVTTVLELTTSGLNSSAGRFFCFVGSRIGLCEIAAKRLKCIFFAINFLASTHSKSP